ncbi:MAG TPA: hypothetical protein VFZ08_00620 [Terriglobia bacterium]|nr:hypothetical protein [Terriglobia bacterium]
MDCRHLEPLYELFLLGALSAGDARQVRSHVEQGCPNCRERLYEAELALYVLLQPPHPVGSSPKQKAHILEQIKGK